MRRSKISPRKRMMTALIGLSSLVMLAFALPQLMSELSRVPGNESAKLLRSGAVPDLPTIEMVESTRTAALGFADRPKSRIELALAFLAKAQSAEGDEAKAKLYAGAERELVQALSIAPIDAYGWLLLTRARYLQGPAHYADAVQSWQKSIEVAPMAPYAMSERIHFGILLYDFMTVKEREILKENVRYAFNWYPQKLRVYADRNNLLKWLQFLSEPDAGMVRYFTPR
ncbi:hypothetical protein [Kordiimonas gwangyangensis]|uniref:hypothetical protein n=1 Tax=Kordiimonas gwangyangensis TaxID=288022 RepID=UPI0012DC4DE9|nr:hypothetical protein [Kordiimonas gwangyangensis]